MFGDGEPYQVSRAAFMHLPDEAADGRHVAVFHAHPEDRVVRGGARSQVLRICKSGRKRFFAKDVDAGAE